MIVQSLLVASEPICLIACFDPVNSGNQVPTVQLVMGIVIFEEK